MVTRAFQAARKFVQSPTSSSKLQPQITQMQQARHANGLLDIAREGNAPDFLTSHQQADETFNRLWEDALTPGTEPGQLAKAMHTMNIAHIITDHIETLTDALMMAGKNLKPDGKKVLAGGMFDLGERLYTKRPDVNFEMLWNAATKLEGVNVPFPTDNVAVELRRHRIQCHRAELTL